MPCLHTNRLMLEPYTDRHVDGLHALNADPAVMRFIGGAPQSRDETVAVVQRARQRWADCGYGWWSFIERATGELVGAGCVQNLRRDAALVPDRSCPLEIGWRLRPDRWRQGLASEAAQAMADFAFGSLKADELYAVCVPANTASSKVMERLGMQYDGLQTWYGKLLATYKTTAQQWQVRPGQGVSGASGPGTKTI
jgi:RimJ/RimL family protein N-acetyltransferase